MWLGSRASVFLFLVSMLIHSRTRLSKIFQGVSIVPKYDQTMGKLKVGLAGHVAGGTLMLMSSAFAGVNPIPTAVLAGLVWMQVMSTAKLTELGSWVNLCKNIIAIERTGEGDVVDGEIITVYTDGSKLDLELKLKSEESTSLPSLKELRDLGILALDKDAFDRASEQCKELFDREDILVSLNETVAQTREPPYGAANTQIPKLAEIYKNRQNAISHGNKRMANIIANAPPMEPGKMIERLGTASVAMGGAVFALGAGLYLASSAQKRKDTEAVSVTGEYV
jgi:hypothetical protein